MPVRQLLSALSLNAQRPVDDNPSEGNTIGPIVLSLMYAAQWIVALLLLWVAQPFYFPTFSRRSRNRCNERVDKIAGGSLALRHYHQAMEDLRHVSFNCDFAQMDVIASFYNCYDII